MEVEKENEQREEDKGRISKNDLLEDPSEWQFDVRERTEHLWFNELLFLRPERRK